MVERKGKVMAEVVVNGRYYMPPEDESKPTERNVMHPETNIEQVLVPQKDGTTKNLKEFIGKNVMILDPSKPTSQYAGKTNSIIIYKKQVV